MLTLSQSSAGSGSLSQQTAQPQPQPQHPAPPPRDPQLGASSSSLSAAPATSSALFRLKQEPTLGVPSTVANAPTKTTTTTSSSSYAFALSELDIDPIFDDSEDEDDDADLLELMQQQTAAEHRNQQIANNATAPPPAPPPATTAPTSVQDESHTPSLPPASLPSAAPPILIQLSSEPSLPQAPPPQESSTVQAGTTEQSNPLHAKGTSNPSTSHTAANGNAAPSAPTTSVPTFTDAMTAFIMQGIIPPSAGKTVSSNFSSVAPASPALPSVSLNQAQVSTASPALTTSASVWPPNPVIASPSPAMAGPSRLRLSASPMMEDEPPDPPHLSPLPAREPPIPSSETAIPPSSPQRPAPGSPSNLKGKGREDSIPLAKRELEDDDDFVITAVTSPDASKKPSSPSKRGRGRPRLGLSATPKEHPSATFPSQPNGNPSPSKRGAAAEIKDFLARVEQESRPEPVTAAQRFWDGITVLHDQDRRPEPPSPLEHLCSILGRGDLLDIASLNLPVYRATSARLHTVMEVNTGSAKLVDRTLFRRPALASFCKVFRIWQDSAIDETARRKLDWDYVKNIARTMDLRIEAEDFAFEVYLGMSALPELMNALQGETIEGVAYRGCSQLAPKLKRLTVMQDCEPSNSRYEKGWSGLRDLLKLLGGQTKVISSMEEINIVSKLDSTATPGKNRTSPSLWYAFGGYDDMSYNWPALQRMCLTILDKKHFHLLDKIDAPNLTNLAIDATTQYMDGDWKVTALDQLLQASPRLESISIQLNDEVLFEGALLQSYHPQLRNFKFFAGEQFLGYLNHFLTRHQTTLITLEIGELCYRVRALADSTNRFDRLRLLDYRAVPERITVKVPPLNVAHVAIAYHKIKPKLLSQPKARGNGANVRPLGVVGAQGRKHADPDLNANQAGDKERLYKEEIPECFEVSTLVSITSLELLFNIYKLPELTTELHMMINSRIFPNLLELKLVGERDIDDEEPLYFKQTMLQQLLVAVADSLTLRAITFENFCTVIPPYHFLGRHSVFGPSLEYILVRTVGTCAQAWRITRDVCQDAEARPVGNSRTDASRLEYVHRPVLSVEGILTDDFQFATVVNNAPADAWQQHSFYPHWNDTERVALLEKTRLNANLGILAGAQTHPPERPSARKQKTDQRPFDGVDDDNSGSNSPMRRASTQRNAARKAAEATTQLYALSQPVSRATRSTQLRARMEQVYASSQPHQLAHTPRSRTPDYDDIFGDGLDEDDEEMSAADDDDGEEEQSSVDDEEMSDAGDDEEDRGGTGSKASEEPRAKAETAPQRIPAAPVIAPPASQPALTVGQGSRTDASNPPSSLPKGRPAPKGKPAGFPFHNKGSDSSDSESSDDDGRPRTGGKVWPPGQSARRSTGGKQAPPGYQPPPRFAMPQQTPDQPQQPQPPTPTPTPMPNRPRPQPIPFKSPASAAASSQPTQASQDELQQRTPKRARPELPSESPTTAAAAAASSQPPSAQPSHSQVNGSSHGALSKVPGSEAPPASQRHLPSAQESAQVKDLPHHAESREHTPTPRARTLAPGVRPRSSSPAGDPATSAGLQSPTTESSGQPPAKKARRSPGRNGFVIPTILSRSNSPALPVRTSEERILIEDAQSALAASQSYRRESSSHTGVASEDPTSSRSSRSFSPQQQRTHVPHANGSGKYPPGLGKSIEVAQAIHQDVVDLTSSPEPEDKNGRGGNAHSRKKGNKAPSHSQPQPQGRSKVGRFSRTKSQTAGDDDDESDGFEML